MIRKSNLKLVPPDTVILHRPPEEFAFNGDIDPVMFSNVMHERMIELGGIGLSANQVGINYRMFVLGAGDVKMTVFNPELLETSEEKVSLDEGCLTYPGLYLKVSRPASCKVRYKNIKNETVEEVLHGLTARIFLHEYDHMIGCTFRGRVSQMKWDLANKKKYNRIKKTAKRQMQRLFGEIKKDLKDDSVGTASS